MDAALVGHRVECRFVPEDLTAVSVYVAGRPVGRAVPFVVSAHTHPQVPKPAGEPPPSTGIDYLGLVLAASEDATPGAIRYRILGGTKSAEGAGTEPQGHGGQR